MGERFPPLLSGIGKAGQEGKEESLLAAIEENAEE